MPDSDQEARTWRQSAAERVIRVCRDVYPVRGLIVSPDIDRAFARVARELPELEIHAYGTGSVAEDWVVPPSWEALEGELAAEDGEVLASLKECFLFVAPYSEPIDGWFTKAEIAPRCRTRPDQPEAYALEHRNAYDYRRNDWGITLPHARWEAMDPERRYRVTIRTRVAPGHLRVGEYILPGRREDIICLCSQFDELCNDGQSSAVFAVELLKRLAAQPEREFSYQVLLVPEMMGTLFYAHDKPEVVERTVAMFNLETLGAGETWVLKRALRDGGSLEAALETALTELDRDFETYGFFGAYGNDERVYGWPTLGVPGPGLQRYPFAHYHTHFDTPDLLDRDLLAEAFEICELTIDILERNYVPVFTKRLPPWLTKHGLYIDASEDRERHNKLSGEVLYAIDGSRSVLGLARDAGLPFMSVWSYLEGFADRGFIRKRPLSRSELRAGV